MKMRNSTTGQRSRGRYTGRQVYVNISRSRSDEKLKLRFKSNRRSSKMQLSQALALVALQQMQTAQTEHDTGSATQNFKAFGQTKCRIAKDFVAGDHGATHGPLHPATVSAIAHDRVAIVRKLDAPVLAANLQSTPLLASALLAVRTSSQPHHYPCTLQRTTVHFLSSAAFSAALPTRCCSSSILASKP